MPLNQRNTATLHRTLYGGILEKITLLVRNDDQQEGVVTSYTLYQCRKSPITHTGEPIQADMASGDRVTWYIPACELRRVGIPHVNAVTRIVDGQGRVWQPESPNIISVELFENFLKVECVRLN